MIEFLRSFFVKDFGLKLFSLGLAVSFHYTADHFGVGSASLALQDQKEFRNLPIVVLSSADDVRRAKVYPSQVDVTLRGERSIHSKLQDKEIRVLVDLTGIDAAHDLRKRVEVSTPPGVTYVRISPENVQVVFPQLEGAQ